MTSPVSERVDARYLETLDHHFRAFKTENYRRLRVRSGDRVLDVGCGPGIDTVPLAELVGDHGFVVGLDNDPLALAEARRRAESAGLGQRVAHLRGDAAKLPFSAAAFDACYSERLIQHVADGASVVAELVRTVRPGGAVVLFDTDQTTLSVDSRQVDISWHMSRAHAARFANPFSGRQLYRHAMAAGLVDVEVQPVNFTTKDYPLARYLTLMDDLDSFAVTEGWASADEVSKWRADLEQLARDGLFFMAITLFIVSGRAP